MSGLECRNFRFQIAARESQVTDKVKQLVTGAFVRESQMDIVQIPVGLDSEGRNIEKPGHVPELPVCNRMLDYDNGIVHIAAFYKIVLEKVLYFMKKDESPADADLFRIRHGRSLPVHLPGFLWSYP